MPRSILNAGYSGTIPVKFRELSKTEAEKARKLDVKQVQQRIQDDDILPPDDFKNFIKFVVATGQYQLLDKAPSMLERFPQFTPFFTDLVIKKKDEISQKIKNLLKASFTRSLLRSQYLPEYIQVAIIRILSEKEFQNKDALMAVFRNLKRNAGAYVGRVLLECLCGVVSRGEVIEIREYYDRADNWEKRAIIRMVNNHLSEDEKRPWLKNVKIHASEDPFAIEIFDPKRDKKAGTKKSLNCKGMSTQPQPGYRTS
jgi:hypothetical protein